MTVIEDPGMAFVRYGVRKTETLFEGLMMALFDVVIPIAGHVYLQVEADTEEEAIDKAFNEATIEDVEDWECLEQFNQGNVCYCPSPWEVEVRELSDE